MRSLNRRSSCCYPVMTVLRKSLGVALLLLLACIASCEAATPLIAWSNRDTFSSVSPNDILDTSSLIGGIHDKLQELDFVVVFGAEELSFDDIAKYGGLYGGEGKASLAALQDAVSSAQSSVWGGTEYGGFLTEEISLSTQAIPHYFNEFSPPLKKTGSLQLLLVHLYSGGSPDTVFAKHDAKMAELMKSFESLDASYAAFYTANHDRDKPYLMRFARSLSEGSNNSNGTFEKRQICNRTAAILDFNSTTNATDYCALLCIQTTEYPVDPVNKTVTEQTAIKALYWPSWRELLENNDTTCTRRCNLTTFEFIEDSGNCSSSSLQEEYFSPYNHTTSSIKANLTGSCGCAGKNVTLDPEPINLEVEFIFFGGSVKLPRGQNLPQGFWTMQLMVTETIGDMESDPIYMTRFRLDNELDGQRGLFYPFTIPFSSSYACGTHKDHLLLRRGNLNRFVVTPLPKGNDSFVEGLQAGETNVTNATSDGPVLQFIGLHVQAYGELYYLPAVNGTKEPVFDSIYYCEGYFGIGGWMGTFVVLISVIFLYLASICLFSMQTIDRFDDPRGQTITVENLH